MGNACMSREAVNYDCEPDMSVEPKMRSLGEGYHRNKLEYLDRSKSVANVEDMPLEGTDALI